MKFVVFYRFKPETVDAMISYPSDRLAAVKRVAEKVGGRLESYYWMFGSFDGMAIVETPTSRDAGVLALAITSSGAFAHFETHELIEHDRINAMLEEAKALRPEFAPPGSILAAGLVAQGLP